MSRIRKPSALLAMTLLAAVIAMSACTPATPTPEPKGGGGEFRVVLSAEPLSLNPNLRADDAASGVADNLYNKLVTLDADYRVIPDLAESWTVSEDGLTYTFQLARNVRWHDGQPFTSADVRWTFETIAQGKGGGQAAAARIADIQTPDVATVIMRLKEPWSPFLPTIAWQGGGASILPKHVYQGGDWSQNPANEKPVGTGAFKFGEWVKGDHITLLANTDYFRRGPYLDKVIYRIVQDPSTAVVELLLKGEVDYTIARPAFERIPELQRATGLKVQTFAHPARYYAGFNLGRQPWDDVRVRQAVNMAINRSALVDKALMGYGSPGLGFYTPAVVWAYNPQAKAPAFDLAGAESLLDQAGLKRGPDGMRRKLSLVTANISPYKEMAQMLQEQLKAVGLEVNVALVAPADFTKQVMEVRDFDLALTNGTWGPDPENLNLRFGSKGANQFMAYASAEFDAAIAEGGRQTKLADRAKSYFRAQEILARDLPLIPLAEYVQILTFRDNITGLPQTDARGLVTFQNYSLVRVRR